MSSNFYQLGKKCIHSAEVVTEYSDDFNQFTSL